MLCENRDAAGKPTTIFVKDAIGLEMEMRGRAKARSESQ